MTIPLRISLFCFSFGLSITPDFPMVFGLHTDRGMAYLAGVLAGIAVFAGSRPANQGQPR